MWVLARDWLKQGLICKTHSATSWNFSFRLTLKQYSLGRCDKLIATLTVILSNALGWLQFLTQKWQSFPGKCLTGVFICQEQKTSNNLLSIPLSCNLTVAATSPLQKSYLRFFLWHVNRFNTFPRISGEDSLANISINSWWYFTRSFTFTSQLSGLCILLYASTVITTRPA